MNEYVFFFIALVGTFLCLSDWRLGVYVSLGAGFFQDPIRKLLPGEPVYLTMLAAVYLAVTIFSAYTRGVRFNFKEIYELTPVFRTPLHLFVVLVVIEAFVTLFRFDSIIMAGIGLAAYLTPLPGLLLGYRFGVSRTHIITFIVAYLVFTSIMSAGLYLSMLGFDWTALRTVGEDLIVYSRVTGEPIVLLSGFFRAPEVAAWHTATSICMLVLLGIILKVSAKTRLLMGAMSLFYFGALLLTGRRKFLVEIALFLGFYGVFMIWSGNGTSKVAKTLFIAMVGVCISLLAFMSLSDEGTQTGIQAYYDRGTSVEEDMAGRASLMTIDSLQWVVEENGVFGQGAGTGSQGAQHFGGGAELVGLAAEGGIGKILGELGIPGLALLAWLLTGLWLYLLAIARLFKSRHAETGRLVFGLMSFLLANVFVYSIAHQIFGDLFVLMMLGLMLGFIFATPRFRAAGDSEERPLGRVPAIFPERMAGDMSRAG